MSAHRWLLSKKYRLLAALALGFLLLSTLSLAAGSPVVKPEIIIESPSSLASYNCQVAPIHVVASIYVSNGSGIDSLYYCLDGYVQSKFGNVKTIQEGDCLVYAGSAYMFNLGGGQHCLSVYCRDSVGWSSSVAVNFTVDNSVSAQEEVDCTLEPRVVSGRGFAWWMVGLGVLLVFSVSLLFVCFLSRRARR